MDKEEHRILRTQLKYILAKERINIMLDARKYL